MRHHIARVRGSNPYWSIARRNDLESIIHQEGAGTYFGTKSAAEFLWPDVSEMLQLKSLDTWTEKMSALHQWYPHVVDYWIDQRDCTFDKALGELVLEEGGVPEARSATLAWYLQAPHRLGSLRVSPDGTQRFLSQPATRER